MYLLGGGFVLIWLSSFLSGSDKLNDKSVIFSGFKCSIASDTLSSNTKHSAAYKWPKTLKTNMNYLWIIHNTLHIKENKKVLCFITLEDARHSKVWNVKR